MEPVHIDKYGELKKLVAKWNGAIHDSKFEQLILILRNVFSRNANAENKKVIIFCVFRATISYLKDQLNERLSEDHPNLFIETISGEDDANEMNSDNQTMRDLKRGYFKESKGPSILVCSEVASEGLDFQFCSYIVNYDMPWNPAKLEQRVGRIDRIGQEAKEITVVNLVNTYTIEDYVMSKLFERIKTFESALGPLGQLLGKYQKEFSDNILLTRRTEDQKRKYEQKVMENVENKKREQEQFERNQIQFVAADQYISEQNIKNNAIYKEEVKFIWDSYLSLLKDQDEVEFKQDGINEKYKIVTNRNAVEKLAELIDLGCDENIDRRKKHYYSHVLDKMANEQGNLKYTFDRRVALENLDHEYFSITNPFIMGTIKKLHNSYDPSFKMIRISTNYQGYEEGDYAVFIYRFYITESDESRRTRIEERHLVCNLETRQLYWDENTNIISKFGLARITRSKRQYDIRILYDRIKTKIEEEKVKMADSILEDHVRSNNAKKDIVTSSMASHYKKEISQINNRLAYVQDPTIRANYLMQIQQLEHDRKVELARYRKDSSTISIYCKGIMEVANRRL
jgi:hypothetical protein